MEVGEEINGVRLLDVREISGGILEQVVIRKQTPKVKWYKPDFGKIVPRKKVLAEAAGYTGQDLAGLCAHLGGDFCLSATFSMYLDDILQQLHARGITNRTLVMFHQMEDEAVEPVTIEPVKVWFDPIPLDSFPQGLPVDSDSSVPGDSSAPDENEETIRGWFSRLPKWGNYGVGSLIICLLVLSDLFAVVYAFTSGSYLAKWLCLFCCLACILIWFFVFFSRSLMYVVPGAIARRSTHVFKGNYWVTSYDRERSLMVVNTLPNLANEDLPEILISRGQREPVRLGDGDDCIHWNLLLAAWFSPLPAPRGDKLEDLR